MSAHADHPIPELDDAGLRRFGWTTGLIIAVLFGIVLPWALSLGWPRWPWIVGGVLASWGLAAPASLRPVYRGWMRFGLLMSRVTTPLVLGIVFYGLFTPVSFGMRLFGRDPLRLRLDRKAQSYRIASERTPPDRMEKPY